MSKLSFPQQLLETYVSLARSIKRFDALGDVVMRSQKIRDLENQIGTWFPDEGSDIGFRYETPEGRVDDIDTAIDIWASQSE